MFWEEQILVEGLKEWYEQQAASYDSEDRSAQYPTYEDPGYDPRFPRSTDQMAGPGELIALGVQYSQE